MSGLLRHVVYIYCGEGACPESSAVLTSALKKHLCAKSHQIQTITPEDTIKGCWRQTASAYVIGGGYDLGFIKCLGYEGTQQIKEYVHAGGAYLGICAGSYFACSGIEFDKGGELEVCGERQLEFYPGWCIGPVFGPYDYDTSSGARPARLSCSFPPIKGSFEGFSYPLTKYIYAYFNGGGFFIPKLQYYTKIYEHEKEETPCKKIKCSKDLSESLENGSNGEVIKDMKKHVLCLVSSTNSESLQENGKRKYLDQKGGEKSLHDSDIDTQTKVNSDIDSQTEPNSDKESQTKANSDIDSHTKANSDMDSQIKANSVIVSQTKANSVIESQTEANGNDFRNCEMYTPADVTILAKYDEISSNPAAIVKCNVGKGVAVLSAVHIEYDSVSLDENNEYFRPVREMIKSYDKEQKDCFKRMLLYLGLDVS